MTRGYVATGEGVMIVGTIIGGNGKPIRLSFVGSGRWLSSGCRTDQSDPLPDPMLMLVDGPGHHFV